VLVVSVAPYWAVSKNDYSLAPLHFFDYNKSQTRGLENNCWYDSGDYVIFAQRNSEAVYYLSLAYHHTKSEEYKKEIKRLILPQLECLEAMLSNGIKQFRDQDAHGLIVPPLFSKIIHPNRHYEFSDGEGRDVAALI
jgi:hypothetical protein